MARGAAGVRRQPPQLRAGALASMSQILEALAGVDALYMDRVSQIHIESDERHPAIHSELPCAQREGLGNGWAMPRFTEQPRIDDELW